jgi:amidohydrolase
VLLEAGSLWHTCIATVTSVKTEVRETLDRYWTQLIDLSRRIHANPELGFEEEKASTWLAELLTGAGFEVVKGIYGLPTAFRARAGSGLLHVAICAEYDSLPGIGHACGHNLIAAMSAGAAIAAARIANDAGITATVFGTPAEEIGDGGGKILMMERGAFDGIHAAMMVHPAPFNAVAPHIIAASTFDVEYTGRAAHAAAFPELGINAADALTVAQTAVGLLRQHILPSDRIHGIVTHGGDAPNIVPALTRARYTVRSETEDRLHDLLPKVHRCFDAGAIATGCKHRIIGGSKPYAHMAHDLDLAALYRANALALGRTFPESHPLLERFAASTDMGNVSQRIPSIHPLISIDSLPAVNHQPEFADHCVSAAAEEAIFAGALALAWTVADVAFNESLRERLVGLTR